MKARRTIGASDNSAVLGGMRAKNNGRYNGNGREWRTPPELFARLNAEFNFTLDPCSTDENALCIKHFTEAQNGLEQDWRGERVFMNPPYGAEVRLWTRKARTEALRGTLVVGLLPASTDLAWWHEDVVPFGEVRYLRGRVRFLTDGPYRASGFFASVVVVWWPYANIVSLPKLRFSGPVAEADRGIALVREVVGHAYRLWAARTGSGTPGRRSSTARAASPGTVGMNDNLATRLRHEARALLPEFPPDHRSVRLLLEAAETIDRLNAAMSQYLKAYGLEDGITQDD